MVPLGLQMSIRLAYPPPRGASLALPCRARRLQAPVQNPAGEGVGRRLGRQRARRQPRCDSWVSRSGGVACLGVSRALQPPPSGSAPASTVRAGITFVLARAVWRSLGSDRIPRMEQNQGGERRAGWRWGLRGQCIALYCRWLPRQPLAPAPRLQRRFPHIWPVAEAQLPSGAITVFDR